MKELRVRHGVLAILLTITVLGGIAESVPASEQSLLVKTTLRYERLLTTPDDTPASQRPLLAVVLALVQTQTTDVTEVVEAYLIAASDEAQDREKRSTDYTWSGSAWEEISRTTNTYDGVGNLTQVLWEDKVGGSWVNRELELSVYDGNKRLTMSTNQTWVTDHWVNESRSTFTYNGSGQMSEIVFQDWGGAAWVNTWRATMTYTGANVTTSIQQQWSGGAWLNFSRTTNSYDGSNNLTQMLMDIWEGGAWVASSRFIFTYDGNGYLVQNLTQTWDAGVWENVSKNDYTNDGSGREIIDVYSFWTDPVWMAFDADTSRYSGNNLVEVVHLGILLSSLDRTQYFYNGEYVVEEIDQTWVPGSPGAWTNQHRTTYEYEAGGTAVLVSDEPAPAGWELNQNYPNPFNPSTAIRYSLQRTSTVEITVYNMLGQAVKTLERGIQAPGVYETTWDGTDASGQAVASGMYLYRISTSDFSETRKMMLLK